MRIIDENEERKVYKDMINIAVERLNELDRNTDDQLNDKLKIKICERLNHQTTGEFLWPEFWHLSTQGKTLYSLKVELSRMEYLLGDEILRQLLPFCEDNHLQKSHQKLLYEIRDAVVAKLDIEIARIDTLFFSNPPCHKLEIENSL